MNERPQEGRVSFVTALVFAAMGLALAIWIALTGQPLWGLGLGLLAAGWVVYALMKRPRRGR